MADAFIPSPQLEPSPLRRWRVGLPFALCPILTWLGFANPLLQIPLLVVLFPVLLFQQARHSRTRGQAFKRGWLMGGLTFSLCLYWVVVPVHYFGGLAWIAALPCPLLLGAYLGLFPAAFCLGTHWASRTFSWPLLGLFAALLWVLLEWFRGIFLTGFPWLGLAQAFSAWPASIQTLQYIGALGLTGVIVLCSIWLTAGYRNRSAWIGVLLILSLTTAFGIWKLKQPLASRGTGFSALIVQGNIDQNRKWDPAYQQETLNSYLELSRRGLQTSEPDLVLWPETAMPFYLQESKELTESIRRLCQSEEIDLITGAPGYTLLPGGGYHLHNRAYLFDRSGSITDYYSKQHLVPFGEYVPFSRFLPFLSKLVQGVGDFAPGPRAEPLKTRNLAMGILICYEIIFEQLADRRVDMQSNVLINLSNDAWFGRTSAPRQHLHQAVLRAVEQQRFVIRATNSGISAVITPRGTLRARSDLFETQIIHTGELSTLNSRTVYSRYRNTGLLAGAVLFALMLGAGLLSPGLRRESTGSGDENRNF